MNRFMKVLCLIPLVFFYTMKCVVLTLIPKRFRYKDVSEETVLITGGSRGLGRELAIRFANRGSRVILVATNLEALEETKRIIGGNPNLVSVFQCDVSNREEVYAMARKIKDEIGTVTILVNNAGIVTGGKFLECPDDKIQKSFEVNALAHFWTCKAFLPAMIARNHGHLVTVASAMGFVGTPRLTDYCASKHAAVGFEKCLRTELEANGISGVKMTLACPHHFTSDLFQGCKTWILKSLETGVVADEIISAVLLNQQVVFIPVITGVCTWIINTLPTSAVQFINDAFGINNFMADFKGMNSENCNEAQGNFRGKEVKLDLSNFE